MSCGLPDIPFPVQDIADAYWFSAEANHYLVTPHPTKDWPLLEARELLTKQHSDYRSESRADNTFLIAVNRINVDISQFARKRHLWCFSLNVSSARFVLPEASHIAEAYYLAGKANHYLLWPNSLRDWPLRHARDILSKRQTETNKSDSALILAIKKINQDIAKFDWSADGRD